MEARQPHAVEQKGEPSMADQKHTGNSGNFADDRNKASEAGKLGGQHSSGHFASDQDRTSESGRTGGHTSSGGTHEQHVKAGQQSHKNA
jgi:uncharacterized protein